MFTDLRSLFTRSQYRQILTELVRRDLRARYKVSVLGFFWSLLRPLFSMLVIFFVFDKLVGFKIDLALFGDIGYLPFIAFGYLPWVYFSSTLTQGTEALLANAQLVKKVYCPRAIFPLTTAGAQLVNFLLALLVLIPGFWILSGAKPTLAILVLPFILILQTLFLMGLVMALATLNVLYRDVAQILDFTTLAWFYLTPVLYPVNMPVPQLEAFGLPVWLIWMNPVATMTFWYRYACLGTTDLGIAGAGPLTATLPAGTAFMVIASVTVFLGGYTILKKFDIRAVDEL